MFQIIKTAFQLGDGKVGTAEEIPLVRRAQLSVVAHIRHVYTDYDKLLRQMPYNDARHSVETATLARLVEWRGDDDKVDEATRHAAADALREVIVISDEEETESEGDYEPIGPDHLRVEELASSAYAPGPGRQVSPDPSVGDSTHPNRILPQVLRRYRPTQDEIAQRDLSRYAVWDQAKRDYRSSNVQKPPTVLERVYEPDSGPSSRVFVPLDSSSHPSGQVLRTQPPLTATTRAEYEVSTLNEYQAAHIQHHHATSMCSLLTPSSLELFENLALHHTYGMQTAFYMNVSSPDRETACQNWPNHDMATHHLYLQVDW